MKSYCLYIQAHQPRLLKRHPGLAAPFDDILAQEMLNESAVDHYLPANALLSRLVQEVPAFRVCLGVSGTLLEQARRFQPDVIRGFRRLAQLGAETGRVEFACETYYHSFAAFFNDGNKEELEAQVLQHRDFLGDVLGVRPTCLRNTELMYSNAVAGVAHSAQCSTVLCALPDDALPTDDRLPTDRLGRVMLLAYNRPCSELLAGIEWCSRNIPVVADALADSDAPAPCIGWRSERLAHRPWRHAEAAAFWSGLTAALQERGIALCTPGELASAAGPGAGVDVETERAVGWQGDAARLPMHGNCAQQELFRRHQDLEPRMKAAGDANLLSTWRNLGAADNFAGMRIASLPEGARMTDGDTEPLERIVAFTTLLTQLTDEVHTRMPVFNVRRAVRRPRILLVTPEVTELPAGIGNLANFISAKGGGLADISAALVAELLRLGLDIHVALPKYERQIREYAHISQQELDRMVSLFQNSEPIHLIPDYAFSHLRSVYESSGAQRAEHRAVAFQRAVINNVLDSAMPENGSMLVHCNDWMTGLIPAAAKSRGVSSLFTVHNIHTGRETLRALEGYGIDVSKFWHELYLERHPDFVWNAWESVGVDFLLSGVKAADYVNTVSPTFLEEIVNGFFPEIVNWQFREALRAKYHSGKASGILNAPKNDVDPRLARGLRPNYDETNAVEAKQENKLAFQQDVGLICDAGAPLFFWPHRLYDQKGPALLAEIARGLIDTYEADGLQIAVVGNGDPRWEEALGIISIGSGGRIAYRHFDPFLSELGKAASDFILMPSLYEPCGLPQMEGMRYGSLPIVRATGGLKDTVTHLNLDTETGNGFVFNDFLPDALWWACTEAMAFYRRGVETRRRVVRRVMREGMTRFNLERTTLEYVRIYETLLGEKLI